jgi:hypothetical protein
MIIHVTQEDIQNGKRRSVYACPVARAVRRTPGCEYGWAGTRRIGTTGGPRGTHDTPENVRTFMGLFDAQYPVEPFSFELADAK